MRRLAWIAAALLPVAAMAQNAPAPAERPAIARPEAAPPVERPQITKPVERPRLAAPMAGPQAPRESPRPVAPRIDYQAALDRAVENPEARVLIRDRATGAVVDELDILYFLSIPPEAIDPETYELLLVDPEANLATTLPHAEFQAFSRAHPEFEAREAAIEPAAGWMPVRRAFFDSFSGPPEAAYYVILVAGSALEGDPRMLSAGEALCGQPEFSEEEGLDPENLAVIAAPVAKRLEEGDTVSLAGDYDYERAAYWLDTLTGTALGREAAARLGADAFGFVAAAEDPTRSLEAAAPAEFDAADAIYIDLSAISPGYVEEVVERIVRGMHEGDATSHTGAIAVLEAFSLVERVGAATLEIAGLLEPSAARAAPPDDGC